MSCFLYTLNVQRRHDAFTQLECPISACPLYLQICILFELLRQKPARHWIRASVPHAPLRDPCAGSLLYLETADPAHLTHFLQWMGYLFRLQSGAPDHSQKRAGHLLLICPLKGLKHRFVLEQTRTCDSRQQQPDFYPQTKCRLNRPKAAAIILLNRPQCWLSTV